MKLTDRERQLYSRMITEQEPDPAALFFLSKHEEELGNETELGVLATRLGQEILHFDPRLYGFTPKRSQNQSIVIEPLKRTIPSAEEFIKNLNCSK